MFPVICKFAPSTLSFFSQEIKVIIAKVANIIFFICVFLIYDGKVNKKSSKYLVL
jgi:hypothetical protein